MIQNLEDSLSIEQLLEMLKEGYSRDIIIFLY